jgi:sodium transport system permease protein
LRIDPGIVSVLLSREIRCALREKNIIVNSILIPFLLYPFMLWGALTVVSIVEVRTAGLRPAIAADERLQAAPGMGELMPGARLLGTPAGVPESLLSDGSVDAWIQPGSDTAGFCGRPPLEVLFDGSLEPGRLASRNIRSALEQERNRWLTGHLSALGIPGTAWMVYEVDLENTATRMQMGTFLLGLIIPLTFVVMASVGCFYPAVDTFAGERERGTWETTLSTAASRMEILTAKLFHIMIFGFSSAILNLTAMVASVSAILGPLLQRSGEAVTFAVPLRAVPFLLLGALLVVVFLATGMIFFGAYARTYKEGQASITPFYILSILPVVFLQSPGLSFTAPIAAIPVVNVAMMIREALQRPPDAVNVLIAVCVTAVFAVVGLAASARLMGMEQVLSPPDGLRRAKLLRMSARRAGKAGDAR